MSLLILLVIYLALNPDFSINLLYCPQQLHLWNIITELIFYHLLETSIHNMIILIFPSLWVILNMIENISPAIIFPVFISWSIGGRYFARRALQVYLELIDHWHLFWFTGCSSWVSLRMKGGIFSEYLGKWRGSSLYDDLTLGHPELCHLKNMFTLQLFFLATDSFIYTHSLAWNKELELESEISRIEEQALL